MPIITSVTHMSDRQRCRPEVAIATETIAKTKKRVLRVALKPCRETTCASLPSMSLKAYHRCSERQRRKPGNDTMLKAASASVRGQGSLYSKTSLKPKLVMSTRICTRSAISHFKLRTRTYRDLRCLHVLHAQSGRRIQCTATKGRTKAALAKVMILDETTS